MTSSPGGLTCTTATTACTVSGLTNFTAYTFTVTATNADAAHRPGQRALELGHAAAERAGDLERDAGRHGRSPSTWSASSPAPTNYTVTSSPGGQDLHHRDADLHGDGPDQRHRLHLHRPGQLPRPELGDVGAVGDGHAAAAGSGPARAADGARRHRGQRPGERVVDRAGQHRQLVDHQLHGDLVAGGRHLHHQRHQLHRAGPLDNFTAYTFTATATNAAAFTSVASAPSNSVTPMPAPPGHADGRRR